MEGRGGSSSFGGLFSCCVDGKITSSEELQKHVVIPQYLRDAMMESIRGEGFVSDENNLTRISGQEVLVPSSPIVVFINSRSGGRQGPRLLKQLKALISEEQVFDILDIKPNQFFKHALDCLDRLAEVDNCAREICQRLRVLVAGGDGTVGWVLSAISESRLKKSKISLPVGIIPLGTGNDLARSFGWGGTFIFTSNSAVKNIIIKAINSQASPLDSWQVTVSFEEGMGVKMPPALIKKRPEADKEGGSLSINSSSAEGVFYNYFSIGMDAQVAYGFHQLREAKSYLTRGPFTNKMIYSWYACTQGWFCTDCVKTPELKGINQVVQIYVKKREGMDWERVDISSSVRAIVLLNLDSYASGRNPWGYPSEKYLDKKGFVKAKVDDGLIEIFALKNGWHSSFVMAELITARHIAQVASLKLEMRGCNKRDYLYFQMDGEPSKFPLSSICSTTIEIQRSLNRAFILNPSLKSKP